MKLSNQTNWLRKSFDNKVGWHSKSSSANVVAMSGNTLLIGNVTTKHQ